MTELTVYDLMGEDHTIWAKMQLSGRHVDVEIRNNDDNVVFFENSHIFAWESLVSFAKQVLACDERLKQEIEIND